MVSLEKRSTVPVGILLISFIAAFRFYRFFYLYVCVCVCQWQCFIQHGTYIDVPLQERYNQATKLTIYLYMIYVGIVF